MGESKLKKYSHLALRSGQFTCIYCGINKSNTVDHMPPRMVFDNKQRPDVLVFPSCKHCNELTRKNDAIISWLSRLHHGKGITSISPEFEKLSRGMLRYPDLVREFKFREHVRYTQNDQGFIAPTDLLTIDIGPITIAAVEQFALKFALAMHWHASGDIVPADVPIWVMATTYYHFMTNSTVREILGVFRERKVMQQGVMTSAGQFSYQSEFHEETGDSIHYGGFRESFAICTQVRPALTIALSQESIKYRRDLQKPYPYL